MSDFVKSFAFITALLLGAPVWAQTITIGSGSGVGGDVIVIPVGFTEGSDVTGVDLDVNFDDTQFSSVTVDCTVQTVGSPINFCSDANAGTGTIDVILGRLDGSPLVTGLLAEITFTIDNAATAGAEALDGVMIGVSDSAGNDLPLNTVSVTDGAITVLGPAYASTPAPGPIDLGTVVQDDTDPTANLDIGNIGAAGSTLVGACSITANSTVFSVDDLSDFSVPETGPSATRVVSCDSSQAVASHAGEMTCTHNGDNIGDAVYSLACDIEAPPAPRYLSDPVAGTPIAMGPVEEGDPITDAQVTISNSGAPGTTLIGTCDVTGHSQISVADGAFSVAEVGPPDSQVVSCDSSEEGNYSATLACEHDGDNPTATYAVTCSVGPAGGALFSSDPIPGSDTPIGVDVVVGDTPVPTSLLTFSNEADPGDMDLEIACSKTAGDAQITVLPDISGGISIAPQASSAVTFSCDTAEPAGNYTATYTCDYTLDGTSLPAGTNGGVQQAIYTYTCDVRDAVSVVVPTPGEGTPLPIPVDPGGTGSTMVVFNEDADEGQPGELTLCSLADGTNFTITDPAFLIPVIIPAGGSVTVTVEGTDPDDGSSPTDILTCTYTDSANSDPGVTVTYPLSLEIGGVASTFEVNKVFSDGNPGDVTVTRTCNSGLPLVQSFEISEGHGVNFVVAGIVSGATDCSVSEEPVSGYTGTYLAAGDSSSTSDSSGCHYEGVESGASNTCRITNDPDPVDVDIEKEWNYAASDAGDIPSEYVLTLYCDAFIVGGSPVIDEVLESPDSLNDTWFKVFGGNGPATFTAKVIPEYPSSHCWVDETVFSDAVETDNDCRNIEVSAGSGDSCKITNTVFFEGIPTLSQYGLAIMALLMLGMGLLGFRRFT
jgi:hypothetical protein